MDARLWFYCYAIGYPTISAELIREDIERLAREQSGIRVPSLRRMQAWLAAVRPAA